MTAEELILFVAGPPNVNFHLFLNLRCPSYAGLPAIFRPNSRGPVTDCQKVLHERRISLQTYDWPVLRLKSRRDLLAGRFTLAIARYYNT